MILRRTFAMRLARRLSILAVVFVGLLSARASACPNCKEALAAQDGDAARLSQGFNYSVLFMLAVPFTLLSAGAFSVVRAVKRGALPPM
jgi:hypothetical protein